MKRLLSLLLITTTIITAQNPEDFFSPINKVANIPQSPEAAAFSKFAGGVNTYTGTPTISIPIYTIQGKEISVPISLGYDASGIKVDQIATNIGLGWNLNYGGVVTRTVNGMPDDVQDRRVGAKHGFTSSLEQVFDLLDLTASQPMGFIHGNHATNAEALKAKKWYLRIEDGIVDYQPDTFSYTANGISGNIFIDYRDAIGDSYKAHDLENPDFNIEVHYNTSNTPKYIDWFSVTDTNGTKYTFAEQETTSHTHSGPDIFSLEYIDADYVTAWYLTKIESANSIDEFIFEYIGEDWTDDEEAMDISQVSLTSSNGGVSYIPSNIRKLGIDIYTKKQIRLANIKLNGSVIVSTTSLSDREDLPGVSSITGLNVNNKMGDNILNVDFSQSYFGTNPTTSDPTSIRLKLDEIKMYRDNSLDAKKHVFTYDNPDDIPDRKSNKVDFWGYYNGKSNNHLAPRLTTSVPVANFFTDFSVTINGYNGANRDPDIAYAKIGTLESIIYPTGGKSTYNYEEHYDENNELVGGLRIKSIKSETLDPETGENKILEKFYYYNDLEALGLSQMPDNETDFNNLQTSSSGIAQQTLNFTEGKRLESAANGTETSLYMMTNNRIAMAAQNITYGKVSEIAFEIVNGVSSFNGCTVTEYFNGDYPNKGALADRSVPYVKENLHFGDVKSQIVYDENLNKLQETLTVIQSEDLGLTNSVNKFDDIGVLVYQSGHEFNGQFSNGGSNGCLNISGSNVFDIIAWAQGGAGCNEIVPSYSLYESTPTYNYSKRWKKMVSSTTMIYENQEADSQTSTTTYDYQGNGHYFATEITAEDSRGGSTQTDIIYPPDRSTLVSYPQVSLDVLEDLEDRNQIGIPVEVVKYYTNENGASSTITEISRQRRYFDTFIHGANTFILPSAVQVSKTGVNDLEDRMIYKDYDAYGNARVIHYPLGMKHTYIWGYQGDQLLMEIKNSDYTTWSTAMENLVNTAITISDSEANGASEASLRTQFYSIQNDTAFENSQISCYTHDPGIGVTSMIDLRGQSMFYFYDQHNRLDYVLDQYDKILSKNEYNLRENN